ncbi:MAG: hypothetical protein GX282_00220 [Campylobacteraceae bacterium]|nr:hypothetical protein [Campylobacteraceae bacterium]
MPKNEVIYKFIILLLLFILAITITLTALMFVSGSYGLYALHIHKFSGVLFLFVMALHILTRRDKLKKITTEFIKIITSKNRRVYIDSDEIASKYSNLTLSETLQTLDIKKSDIKPLFEKYDIKFQADELISEIATKNKRKEISLFALLLEAKFEANLKNSTSKNPI